jgi:hypothetical protein
MLIAGRLAMMHRALHGPEPREPDYFWFGRNARFAGAVKLHTRRGTASESSRRPPSISLRLEHAGIFVPHEPRAIDRGDWEDKASELTALGNERAARATVWFVRL